MIQNFKTQHNCDNLLSSVIFLFTVYILYSRCNIYIQYMVFVCIGQYILDYPNFSFCWLSEQHKFKISFGDKTLQLCNVS